LLHRTAEQRRQFVASVPGARQAVVAGASVGVAVLTTSALIGLALLRCSLHTITGAAQKRFW